MGGCGGNKGMAGGHGFIIGLGVTILCRGVWCCSGGGGVVGVVLCGMVWCDVGGIE